MIDGLLESHEFNNFVKTDGKIGVRFHAVLNTPHWDNAERIEESFKHAARVYANESAENMTVLGRPVQGKFMKHIFDTERGKRGVVCVRTDFEDLSGSGSGEGSGDATAEALTESTNKISLFVLIPLGLIVLIAIIVVVAVRTNACQLRNCF